MKFTLIVATFFFLSFSGWAGTFLETFDDKNLEGWGELWADKGPAVWEVVDDELRSGKS